MEKQLDTLIWIVTGKCNLNCPYCYAYIYRREEHMSIEKAYQILNEAVELGVQYINFTGGEPILYPDLSKILRQAYDLGIETSVFSNLTLMNNEWANTIARYSGEILTSLDGPREIYEKIKGTGNWPRFLKGLNIVKKHGIDIHVNITISKLNYKIVDQAIREAIRHGIESISVIPAMASGRAVETKTFIGKEEFIYALDLVENIAREYGIEIAVWCAPFLVSLEKYKNLVYSNCRYWRVLDISPSGKILLCDVTGKVIADAVKNGLINAWQETSKHPLMKQIWRKPIECIGCKYVEYCRGGCFARALLYWNKLPAPDPLCPLIRII